jgi:hypothetical protein
MLNFLGQYDFSGVQSLGFLVHHDSVSFLFNEFSETRRPDRKPARPSLGFNDRALKARVSAPAQGFLSLLSALVITGFTAIRATAIAPEADVIAGHAFAHLDFEVRAALDAGCRHVSNAFTG